MIFYSYVSLPIRVLCREVILQALPGAGESHSAVDDEVRFIRVADALDQQNHGVRVVPMRKPSKNGDLTNKQLGSNRIYS